MDKRIKMEDNNNDSILTSDYFEGHSKFWTDQLSEIDSFFDTRLLADIKEVKRDDTFTHILSNESTEFLRKVSKNNDIALFTIFISGLVYASGKFFNEDKINIKTPIYKGNIDSTTGVNNVPLIFNLNNEDISVKDHIMQIQSVISKSYTYQNFPLENLDSSLFDEDSILSDIVVRYSKIHQERDENDKYGLLINLIDDKQISISFQQMKEGVNSQIMSSFAQFIDDVLAGFNKKESLLKELTLINREDGNKELNFNTTAQVTSKFDTVIEAFENQVKLTPNNTALCCNDNTLTYKELNQQVNKLAHHLAKNYMLKNPDVIGVMLPKSDWSIVVLLAVLKVGAVYLPIGVSTPKERLNFILGEVKPKILISYSEILKETKLEEIKTTLFFLDSQFEEIESIVTNYKPIKMNGSDLAYIIFTSGSTGESKGVLINHRSLLNVVKDHIAEFKISHDDVYLQFMALPFDGSILDIFTPLLGGATLLMPTKDIILSADKMINYIKDHKVTITTITPSYLNILKNYVLPSLRIIVSAGETAKPGDLMLFANSKTVYNGYGPSEAAINTTLYKIESNNVYVNIPIGAPRFGKNVHIVDGLLRKLPLGALGEICISGSDLALGYLNDEVLTNKSFISNPFGKGTLYKTGDFGRWLPNGTIDFFGRKDDQIKINGYRIDLNEIEKTIAKHNLIEDVVVVFNTEGDKEEILSFLILKQPVSLLEKEMLSLVKEHTQNYLPHYMCPADSILVEKYPISINGKVDKSKLLSLFKERISNREETNVSLPISNIEKELVEIWKEVLELKKVAIEDNFFTLGGHSLKAIHMLTKIQESLNISLDIQVVFNSPTIKELASIITNQNNEDVKVLTDWVKNNNEEETSSNNETLEF